MTIGNTGAAAPGTYTVTVSGTDGVSTYNDNFSLTIQFAAPGATTLTSPANGAVNVANPVLNWGSLPAAQTYEVQVATDAGFTTIVASATGLTSPSYTPAGLINLTTYYWRTRAVNICGNGMYSSIFSFTTANIICGTTASTNVPVTIPTGPATVTSTLAIPTCGTITGVKVQNLNITHTWVGDLRVTLTSPLGTIITLFDRPGRTTTGAGCSGDNLAVGFDDAAILTATDFENACGNLPAISGTYQPVNLLSGLNGQNMQGTWTLTVHDEAAGDGGTLDSWQLEICSTPCGATPTITTTGTLTSFTACSGNASAEQSFTVSGTDLTANLVVTAPADFEVSTTSGSGFGSSVSLVPSSGTVPVTTIYVRMAATATGTPSGNITCTSTGATTQNIAVSGTVNTAPTITCPANITVSNAANQCGNTVSYTPTVAGSPAPTVTYSFSGATTGSGSGDGSGSFFNVGTTTVTLTATNTCGTASCSFTVTVNDVQPPVMNCPPPIQAFGCSIADAPAPYATIFEWAAAGGNGVENCFINNASFGLVSQNLTSSTACSKIYTRIYSVADVSGNVATCSQTVTVTDNTPPVVTCPANIVVSSTPGVCGAVVNFTPTATDNCGEPTITSVPASGSTFPVGTTTVTVTATDACGNTATCTFTVTVNDVQPPVITCPANIVVSNAPGTCGAVVNYTVTATDNCPGVTVSSTPASGSTFPVGTTTVTSTATDAAGNTATCTFTVTVNDVQPPVITCPANIVVSNAPGTCGAVVNYTVTATDNCPGVTVSSTPASGSTFPVGTTTVTSTATDAAGNTATCTFTVRVNDTEPPVITCPTNITVNATAGLCAASVATPNPTNTDNCAVTVRTWTLSGATTGASPLTGLNNVGTQTFNVGVTTVTYTSRDAAGNTATCTFTVTVNDVQPPVITCPANIVVSNDPNLCSAVVTYSRPTATDNCTQPVSNFSVAWSQTGQRGVFFDITNIGSAAVQISGFSPAMWGAAALTDNFSVYFTTSATTYFGNQTNAGAWTLNTTAPVSFPGGANPVQVSVPLATPITLAPGQSRGVYIVGTLSFGGGPVAYLSTSGIPAYTGPQSYQNGAVRFSGGVGSSGLFTGIFGTGLPGNIRLFYGSVNVSPVITQVAGIASGGTFPVGLTTNVFQATDPSGNTSTCSFTVRVNDTQAPTITCPANITVTSPAGSCTAVVNYTGTANDNCPGATVQLVSGPASGSAFPVGVTTVTLRAVDAAGNVSTTCSFTVTVLDGQLPVITAQPQNRTVCVGQSATFSVSAVTSPNANGPLSYQWQSWNGSAWVNVSGATASSFTVSNVTLNQNTNSYRVLVIGLCTTVPSNHATLYVNPNPTVSISTNIAPALLPGQNLTLTAVPSIAGGTYQWFKNGVAIAGATASTLGPLTVSDAGTYRVVYTAPTGCVGTSADLVVSALASPGLWVYPNPNQGTFYVRYYNQTGEKATVKVYNAIGQELYSQALALGIAYSTIQVNLYREPAGTYIVKVLNGAGVEVASRKIIVYHP
jgi:subtilisin-like proprotein convertase family protein